MPCIRLICVASLAALSMAWPGVEERVDDPGSLPSAPSSTREYDAMIRPFLSQHCFRCHGDRKQKAGLRIDTLSTDFASGPSLDHWVEVVDKLISGEMPPEGQREPPTSAESGRVAEWIATRIEDGRASRLARRERVSFHRLTREEYANTILDLLGVHFDVSDAAGLNADDSWRGFDRIGSVLSLSPSHLEKYLVAAETILDEAYPEVTADSEHFRFSSVDLAGGPGTYGEQRYAMLQAEGRSEAIRVDLWPGQRVRVKTPDDSGRRAGLYRFRVQLSGLASGDGRVPHLAVHAATLDRMLFDQDITSTESEPVQIEFEAHLPAGAHEFELLNEATGPAILTRLGRKNQRPFFSLSEGRIPWQLPLQDDDGLLHHPLLIVDWMECEGPLATGSSAERQRYMPSTAAEPTTGSDLIEVRTRIAAFAERAFRRPLKPGEIDPFVRLIEAELAASGRLRPSVKAGMLAVLCSPSFLYLEEGDASTVAHVLDSWELAARLSYLLWSTAPDDELRALALRRELLQPAALETQLRRMLADPRSERFAQSFARQWLQLDRVGMFTPNGELYPDYNAHLKRSMVKETTSFFSEVLSQNLGLVEFLDSDWTMLDPRMARHYGIPGVDGAGFRRVALDPEQQRGGILTHASTLSLTSDGTRHRPVHRGVWLSESILGQFPPAPPASVEPIEPTPIDAAKATVRMRLDAHKRNPACFACHRKIDPYGFAFDNYDAVGSWRTEELVTTGTGANPAVDASGVLPDGRTFTGAAGLKVLLIDDIDRFAAAFVEKLATYALRRPMGPDDREQLDHIAAQAAAGGYRLQDTLEALVLSSLFTGR